MNWHTLTIHQFQQIAALPPAQEGDELGPIVATVAILNGMTETQVDSLTRAEFAKLVQAAAFLQTERPPYDPVKHVTANGKRYRMQYDISQMRAARYIESKTFAADVVQNLHLLAASMCVPQRRDWLGRWVDQAYDATKHSDYAEDLRHAPFLAIYSSVLFFCQVFATWMRSSRASLIQQIMKQGMNLRDATEALTHSCSVMDGIIKQNSLPDLSASRWTRHLTSPRSTT